MEVSHFIQEIKGLRVSDQLYPHSRRVQPKRATDIRAAKVTKDYELKAKALDVELCPELVNANLTGAFEHAYRSFAFNGVVPMVFGAFGETNEGSDSIIQCYAKLASKTHHGSWISPEAYGSARGPDALQYTLHLAAFRCYLGVQIVKANARLNRQRLHLVGRTAEEAQALARSQPTRTSWNPGTDCPFMFPANYNSQGPYHIRFEFLNTHGSHPRHHSSSSRAFHHQPG